MKVTILGNNSALPAYDRHPTSQIVSFQGQDIMLDCGKHTDPDVALWHALAQHGLHLHFPSPRRSLLWPLRIYHNYELAGPCERPPSVCPAPLEELINTLLSVAASVLCYKLIFHPLPESGSGLLVDEKQFSVSCFPVEHRIPCYGFLVTEKTKGRKLLPEKCVEFGHSAYFYDPA